MGSGAETFEDVLNAFDPDNIPEGKALMGGRFTIDLRLGRGGMASVYLAKDRKRPGQEVALKILAQDQHGRFDSEQRLRDEMRIAEALIDIPGIVRPLEVGRIPELDNRLYMLQEFVPASRLTTDLVDGALDPVRACTIVRDVARTLQALHQRGVIHRDVKPSNILYEDKHVYLIDFGFAHSQGTDGKTPSTAGLTKAHQRPGTARYMAPEQAMGAHPAPSFDIYALCVTLYQLLCGKTPLFGRDSGHVLKHICAAEAEAFTLRGKRDDLPEALLQLVEDGLQPDPDARIPSAKEIAERLDSVIAELEPAPSASPPLSQLAIGAVAVVALGIGGGWALAQLWPSSPTSSTDLSPSRTETAYAAATSIHEPATTRADPLAPMEAPALAEPLPEDKPAPKAAPEPHTQRTAKRPRRGKKTSSPPAPSAPNCEQLTQRARKAARARQWKAVLHSTRVSSCWTDPQRRLQLRVDALHALRRYDQCVKEGKLATSRSIKLTTQFCRDKREATP